MPFTTKQTKGIWKTDFINSDFVEIKSESHLNKPVATLNSYYYGKRVFNFDELNANAKLISAVPELLQCTEMLYDLLSNEESKNSIAMEAVKSTLIKAGVKFEGKSHTILTLKEAREQAAWCYSYPNGDYKYRLEGEKYYHLIRDGKNLLEGLKVVWCYSCLNGDVQYEDEQGKLHTIKITVPK